MGVRGLTSYLKESAPFLGRQIELRDTKLIIDGDNLCNYLYKENGFDCRCGGQYEEFYMKVLLFFDALKSKGVEYFVVLDGAYDKSDKKLETQKKRAQERIETADRLFKDETSPDGDEYFLLPLLAKFVFAQVLRNHLIRFAVSDCKFSNELLFSFLFYSEADPDIASLAREWKCPVLRKDCDFFIFDVKGGFIPLSSFDVDHLTPRIFYRSNLARYFGIREELLPLFASLLGNDYVSWEALKSFNRTIWTLFSDGRRGKEVRFLGVASLLSQFSDSITETKAFEFALELIEPGESRERLKQAVEYSLQEYTVTKSNVLNYFRDEAVCSLLRTQNNLELEEEVLRMFREGKFSTDSMSGLAVGKVFLRAQVEDRESRSSNQCSLSLRKLAYEILSDEGRNMKKVEEWDREGIAVKHTDIKPYNDGVPSLSSIPSLDLQRRLTLSLDALDSDTAYMESLPKELPLVATSLRFLLRNGHPPLETSHLSAILCSCVQLEDDSRKQYLETRKYRSQPFDERAAQSFCQWQCVLRDVINLNFVLSEPLQTPCIQKTFNGRLAHCLQDELNEGRRPETLLCSPSIFLRYKELYTAITDREVIKCVYTVFE
ncbi:protein asteroid homolog 1-like [Stylophora pistillata]|uniref:protein asteroid homolog 1-like n=1 Tax=Stylophora pistillata TaxID=50429 RepID=UPI000C04CD5E|nr:protein asteroid homolog 1-like [Stylophora pistillata]